MARSPKFKFCLYVAADATYSAQVSVNLHSTYRPHLDDRQDIEVTDVFRECKRAVADGIFMARTLVARMAQRLRRIVGSLSNTHTVLDALRLAPLTP